MYTNTYIPSKILAPFTKAYLIIESQDELVNRVLPDTSLVMAFRYRGKVSYTANDTNKALPASVVTGLRKSGRLIHYAADSGNILVIFKEAGATAFFDEPLHELFEDSVPLHNFDGYKHTSNLEEQLASAASHTEQIALIEQFLVSKLYNHQPDKRVTASLEKIHAANGTMKIKDLARSLYISQDAFEKRFRKIVGSSPKQFASIVRIRSIISQSPNNATLTGAAFDAGYFDQPHFNKDFKLFTGQTPMDFLRSPSFW